MPHVSGVGSNPVPGAFSIDGVLSGLKTGDIIQQLMSLERRPLQLLQSQRAREQTRLEAVQRLRSQIVSLQNLVAQLLDRKQVGAKSVTTDSAATSPVLTGTASAVALNGSFTVTVSQLATPTRVLSSGPIGQVIDPTVALTAAGFRIDPITENGGAPASFSINGVSIQIDSSTTLDDGTASSVIARINAAGAGVTASLIPDRAGRANNLVQLVSDPGETIQVGSLGDSSNLLKVLHVTDASVEGNTAATVTSGVVAAGALSTSIVVGGVTVTVDQNDASFTAAQNAGFIVRAVNATASPVQAVDRGDGTFTLEHKTLGSQQVIAITAAGVGTGLSVGTTRNGTDRLVGTGALGVTDLGKRLADSRLSTPISGLDPNGEGAFTINGIQIRFSQADSLATIINRINASNTGVTAFYDPIQDRVRLTAAETGGRAIALADTTGNFLAAISVLSGDQIVGQPARFSIEGVNDGQPLVSSSNTVSGYIPGVTLQLRAPSAAPVTVTVSQDTGAALGLARSFVQSVNAVLDYIAEQTRHTPGTGRASALAGDLGVRDVERVLRSLLGSAGVGLTGRYRSLADIGLSTGAVGSAAGTTRHLILNEAKLTAALQDNPEAVTAVLSGLLGSLGTPAGAGNIATASGLPTDEHEDGTYYVKVLDASGLAEVRFIASDGRLLLKRTGTLLPGAENSSLIPGVKLTANSTLSVGEDSFTLAISSRGVMVRVSDYLERILGTAGLFETRQESVGAVSLQLTRRIDAMEARLKLKAEALARKFTGLEATIARLQAQNATLLSQLTRPPSN